MDDVNEDSEMLFETQRVVDVLNDPDGAPFSFERRSGPVVRVVDTLRSDARRYFTFQ
ncbi:MAG: hypothetical protein GY822_31720 [Deltaproteobacteria bacterium]|nr:hypothetical protein [Deltaproteobacteria bacterium]